MLSKTIPSALALALTALLSGLFTISEASARTTFTVDGLTIRINVPIDLIGSQILEGEDDSLTGNLDWSGSASDLIDKLNRNDPYRGCYTFDVKFDVEEMRSAQSPRPGRHGLSNYYEPSLPPFYRRSGAKPPANPYQKSVLIDADSLRGLNGRDLAKDYFFGAPDLTPLVGSRETVVQNISQQLDQLDLPGCLWGQYIVKNQMEKAKYTHIWQVRVQPGEDGKTLKGLGTYRLAGHYGGECPGDRNSRPHSYEVTGVRKRNYVELQLPATNVQVVHGGCDSRTTMDWPIGSGELGDPFKGKLKRGRHYSEGQIEPVVAGVINTFELTLQEYK